MVGHKARPRGRGTSQNPSSRFDKVSYVPDLDAQDWEEDEVSSAQTQFITDNSHSLITTNDSPDVGFSASINPYRGCEHGCIYCYARPTHEFLGYSAGLDFETKILVKESAPMLLRQELSSPHWKPQVIGLSGVTDPYQPVERRLQLTRRCLEVLVEFRNPVVVITKNYLVVRDADLLGELAQYQAAAVFVSITTLDDRLIRVMEPRTSPHPRRLAAIQALAQHGVPTGVLVAPIIPGLNDHEIPAILSAAAKAGARFAGYVVLRLPYAVADLFSHWLAENLPEKKDRILSRIRSVREGRLNDTHFGRRMHGEGKLADLIESLFQAGCRQAGIGKKACALSTAHFRRSGNRQPSLFE